MVKDTRWTAQKGRGEQNKFWVRSLRKIQCLAIASQKRIRIDGLAWSLYGVFPGLLGQCIPVTYPRWTAGRQLKIFLGLRDPKRAYWVLRTRQWMGEKRYVRTCGHGFFFLEKKNNAFSKKIIHVEEVFKIQSSSFRLPFHGTSLYICVSWRHIMDRYGVEDYEMTWN